MGLRLPGNPAKDKIFPGDYKRKLRLGQTISINSMQFPDFLPFPTSPGGSATRAHIEHVPIIVSGGFPHSVLLLEVLYS